MAKDKETKEVKEVVKTEVVQVEPQIEQPAAEAPVEEVKEIKFEKSEFAKQLQLAIKHYTSVYGQTRDSQAAEIAKSCGTILAKVLSR